MPVGIRFKEAGRIYYFDARGHEFDVGNFVVVDTSHGREIGRVVIAPNQVIASEIKESLKPILRPATSEDLEQAEALKKRAREQLIIARKEAAQQGLKMHVVSGDYSLDGSEITFYFTADDRIEFRNLAKALSTQLETRVQFLQVGDRDRAKIVDGIGRCGERLCCSSWLTTFPTVSIKMAKEQDLPLNPSKLSGACGRLLCCLTYEYEQYREIKGGLPKVGSRISTPTGEARVLKINTPKETILLGIAGEPQPIEMPLDQFRLMYGTAIRPKELTEKFEQELMTEDVRQQQAPQAGPPQAAPSRPSPSRPDRPLQRPGQEIPPPPGTTDGEQPRRRRRRRGGRKRRGGGGGGGPPAP
jgi:cell fate regulator YaaT (PSP1 superfamily)